MNTRAALEAAVCRDPFDRGAVRALADFLYDDDAPSFFAACRVAGHIRRSIKNAADVCEAVHIIGVGTLYASAADTHIRAALGLESNLPVIAFARPGSFPPKIVSYETMPGGRYVVGANVHVGARWIIARWWDVPVMWIDRPDAVPAPEVPELSYCERARERAARVLEKLQPEEVSK